MPPGIGYSFQPGADDIALSPGGRQRAGLSPQAAVKILSLRVPKQSLGGSALAPRQLLEASGAAGVPGASLNQLLQALAQMMQPQRNPVAAPLATQAAQASFQQPDSPASLPSFGGFTPQAQSYAPQPSTPLESVSAPPPRFVPADQGPPQGFGGGTPEELVTAPPPVYTPLPFGEYGGGYGGGNGGGMEYQTLDPLYF